MLLGKLISSAPADGNNAVWTLTLELQFFSLFDSSRHEPVGEECVVAMAIKQTTRLFLLQA